MPYLYILGQLIASVSILAGIVFMAIMMLGNEGVKEKSLLGFVLLSGIVAFGFVWNWWG
jgi:hypothetical protein